MKDLPKRIMIADDDPGIVDAVEMILDLYGYQVCSTYNGNDVLELNDQLPDLLLLDVWMSGCDGRTICKAIKANNDTRHIPVLMLSASTDIKGSVMEAGADAFLAKPFEMKELVKKISQLLQDKRSMA